MQIKLLVEGGEMKPTPALSQKIGPLGLNLGKIISDVNKATSSFKGIKVPVILDIDTKTKNFTVKTLTPPTSELLKKELNLEKGSQMPNKIKVANIPIETVIKIAKIKHEDMLTESFKAAVKSVLGSCVSLGILVESKDPKQVTEEVDRGIYDEIINKKIDTVSEEKAAKLASDFEQVKKAQESLIKELEKKAEEKAAAAASAASSQGASTTTGSGAGTSPEKK
ncbi:MAG: 50S ribosomal protein L11 [Candidatus Pacearchaeota archaeon]